MLTDPWFWIALVAIAALVAVIGYVLHIASHFMDGF
jgi:hypothetical protein